MPNFTITAHIEFPTRTGAIKTETIRMAIPADSDLEARAKAERFINHKSKVVVDTCTQELNAAQQNLADMLGFGDVFKDWPNKS